MSTQRSRRYPGLNYFTTEQKAQFFGRDAEKAALLALVLTEKIVALFGKSGYGKSSLLRAGLIPELPAGWLPVVVQLGAYQPGQSISPLERTLAQLDAALPADTPETAFLENISDPGTLWHRFRRKQGAEKRPFLLIFDQFEEFQTYPPEQRDKFKQQLAELLFTRIPQAVRDRSDELPGEQQDLLARPAEVKALFAIREDRLSVLDSLADKLPAILHKRFHLEGLDDRQATDAIVGPAALPQGGHYESPAFRYDPAAVQAIKQGLKKDEQDTAIESFLLQICCEEIERGVIGRTALAAPSAITVTERDLPVFEDLFEQYYRNKIAALPGEALRSAARRMMEDHLVKTDPASGIAYRINADGRVLCALPGVDESLLKRLTDVFLLRSEPNTTGGFSYEVSHDRLVEGILAMKKEYEAEERERRLAAEAERIAREKVDAERRRRRALATAMVAGLLVLAAAVATVYAFFKSAEAADASQKAAGAIALADEKTLEAARSDSLAQVKTAVATAAEEEAKLQKEIAELKSKEAKTATEQAILKKKEAELAALQAVAAIVAQARRDMLQLDYAAAFSKIKNAAALGALKDSVAFESMEIAYFHHHSGHDEVAREPYDLAAWLLGKAGLRGLMDFEKLHPAHTLFLKNRYFPVTTPVEGGAFDMGCDPGDTCEVLHRQEVSSFQMARYETTWWQYHLFCKATGHRYESPGWGTDGNNPAVNVSWFDAVLYLNWLNKQFGLDTFYIIENKRADSYGDYYDVTPNPAAKKGYRLPTEAEWEYAAGGGNRDRTRYAGTDQEEQLEEYAWYYINSGSRTRATGSRKANALGLHDMSGNVREWCWDWYDAYGMNPVEDYAGPENGSYRVVRGGSWDNYAADCRAANRGVINPDYRFTFIGFRLVFVP